MLFEPQEEVAVGCVPRESITLLLLTTNCSFVTASGGKEVVLAAVRALLTSSLLRRVGGRALRALVVVSFGGA